MIGIGADAGAPSTFPPPPLGALALLPCCPAAPQTAEHPHTTQQHQGAPQTQVFISHESSPLPVGRRVGLVRHRSPPVAGYLPFQLDGVLYQLLAVEVVRHARLGQHLESGGATVSAATEEARQQLVERAGVHMEHLTVW